MAQASFKPGTSRSRVLRSAHCATLTGLSHGTTGKWLQAQTFYNVVYTNTLGIRSDGRIFVGYTSTDEILGRVGPRNEDVLFTRCDFRWPPRSNIFSVEVGRQKANRLNSGTTYLVAGP